MKLPNSLAAVTLALLGVSIGKMRSQIEVEPELESPPAVFDQTPLGSMACGPSSLYNALIAGKPAHRKAAQTLPGADHESRVRALIAAHGQAPSTVYRGLRTRYDVAKGTASGDLEVFANEFLERAGLPEVKGRWLDRGKTESQVAQLRRVHAAFAESELPPIIEVRSFHADVKKEGNPMWEGLFGHFLVVLSVDPIPAEGVVSGFEMHCADSATGRIIPVFVALERYRKYTATRGFTVDEDGKEKWRWARDSPYLVLTAPDLSLRTQRADWHERSIMALTWALLDE